MKQYSVNSTPAKLELGIPKAVLGAAFRGEL